MTNSRFYKALLVGAAALVAGCSNGEDFLHRDSPPLQQAWNVSVQAFRDSLQSDGDNDDLTRSLYNGGNNGSRHAFIWDVGDNVKVYKGNTLLGTLSPTSTGQEIATLSGTLTGAIDVDDELTLYLPNRDLNYSGQNGTIASLSSNYMYQKTTSTVLSAQSSGSTLILSDIGFLGDNHQQTYLRFKLKDNETGERLHPTKLQFFAASGKLVKTRMVDGETTYFNNTDDPLEINTVSDEGEYPGEVFVSVLNDNGAYDTYTLKAWVGDDVYVGPTNSALPRISAHGVMGDLVRTMTKTTAVSTLTVEDIPSKVFTGSAIVPDNTEIVVKDGTTTLTQGTDYSVSYADNTNVGTATVTVKGLADAGAVAATKYLGTQDKTFNIVKATPVIVMDDATMTLVNNTSQNTQTRTVTRVFIDNNDNGTWDEGTDYDITALCTVTYSSSNDAVATVIASTGQVTAAGPTTCTITATVAAAQNWTTQTATYTVNVEQEVNGGNSVNPWDDNNGENTDDGKIYVQ